MQELLKSTLGDCKFSSTSLCKSKSAYEVVNDIDFCIFDPANELNQPVRVVTKEDDHQLKVDNRNRNNICIVKTDKCLFTDAVSKCDCILFDEYKFFLVEIKSSGKRTRNEQRHRAMDQLGVTLEILKKQEIDLTSLDTKAIICFRTDNTYPVQASRSYRREEFRINYNVDLQEGNKIEF